MAAKFPAGIQTNTEYVLPGTCDVTSTVHLAKSLTAGETAGATQGAVWKLRPYDWNTGGGGVGGGALGGHSVQTTGLDTANSGFGAGPASTSSTVQVGTGLFRATNRHLRRANLPFLMSSSRQ